MDWSKYTSSVENYLNLTNRYDLRLEYIDGTITTRTGTPVVLLGDVPSVGASPGTALVMISDVTPDEAEQLRTLLASLRQK